MANTRQFVSIYILECVRQEATGRNKPVLVKPFWHFCFETWWRGTEQPAIKLFQWPTSTLISHMSINSLSDYSLEFGPFTIIDVIIVYISIQSSPNKSQCGDNGFHCAWLGLCPASFLVLFVLEHFESVLNYSKKGAGQSTADLQKHIPQRLN